MNYQALRYAPPIEELGNTLVSRMRQNGSPYLALHLRQVTPLFGMRVLCIKYDYRIILIYIYIENVLKPVFRTILRTKSVGEFQLYM